MAHIIVIGTGIGGMSAAYELRGELGNGHRITVIGDGPRFSFNPSNPWLAVGWRKPPQIQVEVGPYLAKKQIDFVPEAATAIDAAGKQVTTASGKTLAFDYLVICTGPRLAFEEVPGFGSVDGHTQSICTTDHASTAWERYQEFLKNPGPIVVGAVAGASCFGPAYEFAMILDADLRKRKLRDKVPITFVTSEPYVGHMGLGGVGDSKGLLESEFRQRHIKWLTNCKVREFAADKLTAIVHNIKAAIDGQAPSAKATWNAICLADMGDTGAAFVAIPQIPPRNVTWARVGKWVHLAKIAFEKYFLAKMKSGNTEPIYEKYVMRALGIDKLKLG